MISLSRICLISTLVGVFCLAAAPTSIQAESVQLTPPSGPVKVGGAVLKYKRQVSVPRVTIPGTFEITEIIENVGSLTARGVIVKQELPAGWTTGDAKTLNLDLGDIEAGQKVSKSSSIVVLSDAFPGRYANEATVSATGLESILADAPIDLSQPQVLGASTLAETGTPITWALIGLPLILLGGALIARKPVR
jgi:hypothetical protein